MTNLIQKARRKSKVQKVSRASQRVRNNVLKKSKFDQIHCAIYQLTIFQIPFKQKLKILPELAIFMSSFLSMRILKLDTEFNHTLFHTGANAKQLQEASERNDKNHFRKSVNSQAPARQAVHLQRIEVEAGKRRTKEATKEHL